MKLLPPPPEPANPVINAYQKRVNDAQVEFLDTMAAHWQRYIKGEITHEEYSALGAPGSPLYEAMDAKVHSASRAYDRAWK